MSSKCTSKLKEQEASSKTFFALADASNQLHGQPSSSGWFDGARNGLQRFESLTQLSVPLTNGIWYTSAATLLNIPPGRAVVRINKMTRGDSAGFFFEGVHMAASDD